MQTLDPAGADAIYGPEAPETEFPARPIVSGGTATEVLKKVGLPRDMAVRFGVHQMAGTDGNGYTRMATASAIVTAGAHLFS